MCKVSCWDPIIFRRYITCHFFFTGSHKTNRWNISRLLLSGQQLRSFGAIVYVWGISRCGCYRSQRIYQDLHVPDCKHDIRYRPLYNYIQYHYMVKPRILLFKSLVKRNCTQNGRDSKITNFFIFALTNNQSLTGTGLWFNKSGQTAQHYRLWNKNKNWLDYSYKMCNNIYINIYMSEWRDRCTYACRLSLQLSL